MNLTNLFIGSEQSKYASIAIFCAIIAICLCVLFTDNEMTFGQRLMIIFVIIIYTLPYVLLSLFELTCISSYNNNKSGACWWYGSIISAVIIFISVIVVISALMSMLTYTDASNKISASEDISKLSPEKADNVAKIMMEDEAVSKEIVVEEKPQMVHNIPTMYNNESPKYTVEEPNYNSGTIEGYESTLTSGGASIQVYYHNFYKYNINSIIIIIIILNIIIHII